MSAIQNAIERVIEYHEQTCNGGVNSPCNLSIDARAELAVLRASVETLTAQNAEQAQEIMRLNGVLDQVDISTRRLDEKTDRLVDRVTEQVRQLKAARNGFEEIKYQSENDGDYGDVTPGAIARAWLAENSAPIDIDFICNRVHTEWMNYNSANGAISRCAVWGEELMKPWDDLSNRAKDLDRATVRSVLDALFSPVPQAEQEQTK